MLLVAHGTVENLEDLPVFLARIRHGRPPPPGLVAELQQRYTRIGRSPLLDLTAAQARALEAELGCPVFVAMRLWQPSIEEVLRSVRDLRLERLCVVPLAPFSVHIYNSAAERSFRTARTELGHVPDPVFVENWGLSGGFIEAQVSLITEALERAAPDAELILTAHSLPRVVIERGDPYAELVQGAAERIADTLDRRVSLAYQSQGADGGDWLGPTIPEVLDGLRAGGAKSVVLAPFGFLADHVETLYDLDIEARGQAEARGLRFLRVPSLNTHSKLIEALAEVVHGALG